MFIEVYFGNSNNFSKLTNALKNGNSAFIDSNWNAYPDQWDILLNHTMKLSMEEIVTFMKKWKAEITEATGVVSNDMECRPKPWNKKQVFNKSDVVGKMHIVLGDGVYVDALNLMPRIQNQIRSLAAFDNPIFYKNRRLGYSNYYAREVSEGRKKAKESRAP